MWLVPQARINTPNAAIIQSNGTSLRLLMK
jgi:hypothetical protein